MKFDWPPKQALPIVSGYFNPIHPGHIDMFYNTSIKYSANILVIVNNDKQVAIKNSVPFLDENARVTIINSLRRINRAILSIDEDDSVAKTIEHIFNIYNKNKAYNVKFINGGDVNSAHPKEKEVCDRLGIEMVYNIGGDKIYSSSKLIEDAARSLITMRGLH